MSEPTSRWACEPYSFSQADRLARELGLSPVTAAILARRGFAEPEEVERFLAADERHDPLTLPGAPEACELILAHIERGSRIVVFGDYDVDGVCSTAMLVRTLRALGADPAWHLPSRFDGGYGLSAEAVEQLAAGGAQLLVTVDCGVTAVAEVARARELGMDVVVTDHHRPGAELPPCPLVHPALGDYGCPELCASGVVLKLSEALRLRAGVDPAGAEEDLDLAGLATICDMVPLLGENRRIAREGLAALSVTAKPGLRALMKVGALEPGDVSEHAVGFRLGPRLNAAGRLQRADAALELLMTEDEGRAAQIAEELDGLNHDRREAEHRILFEAEAACAPQLSAGAIVVAGEGWHSGVAGIVASRLVERHHRPCVVIALEGGSGRGSGRSISAYDLHAGLGACAAELTRFGGHRMAAGLEIEADRIERFRQALAAHAGAALSPEDLVPVERPDAVVPGGVLGLDLVEELERLGPFGSANRAPALVVPGARIGGAVTMGDERQHARFTLTSGGARARVVAFGTSARRLASAGDEPRDVVVGLERNRWNGVVEPQVRLRALCPTRTGRCEELSAQEPFWEAVEREVQADLEDWWPARPAAPAKRALRDRRGQGVAGVAGDLLSSGERVLVVCAETARRRAGLERLVAGLGSHALPLIAWDQLALHPELAAPYQHLVAFDPPPLPQATAALAAAPGPATAFAHLAWGAGEAEFALAVARAQLDLRVPLRDLWRRLSADELLRGGSLAVALRGDGDYPRSPAVCGRLLRVLSELGLVQYTAVTMGGPGCVRLRAERTELERSASYRAYAERLAAVEGHLGAAEAAAEIPAQRVAAHV